MTRSFRYLHCTTFSPRQEYLRDDELDRTLRALLRRFTTPRLALDGSLVWLVDEIAGEVRR